MLRGRLVEGREGEGRKGRLGATPVEGREGGLGEEGDVTTVHSVRCHLSM